MDEKEIIKKIQGDKDVDQCFKELVSRYKNPLVTFMFRYVSDIRTAEDLSQEAFIRVFRNIRNFDLNRNFSTWLYTIAYNLVKDEYKRRSRHPDTPTEFEATSESETPDCDYESKEKSQMIQKALNSMHPDERAVLILKDMSGMKYNDIAFILGIPFLSVKSNLAKARQHFKEIWTNFGVKS